MRAILVACGDHGSAHILEHFFGVSHTRPGNMRVWVTGAEEDMHPVETAGVT